MAHLRLWILVWIFSISTCKKLKGKSRESNLKFMGNFNTKKGRSRLDADINYFVSTNPTTWFESQHDCERVYGPAGNLVCIETEEEFNRVKRLLADYGDVGSFWTGGYYDPEIKNFLWTCGKTKVTNGKDWSRSPWSTNLPRTRSHASRIHIEHNSMSLSEWSISMSTQNRRYICEVDKSAGICTQNTDMVFALDASLSMQDVMEVAGHFINNITLAFRPYDLNRFGFFLYNEFNVKWIFSLNDNLSQEEMAQRIFKTKDKSKHTSQNHLLAIDTATKELLDNMAPGVPGNIVIITDGEVKEDENAMLEHARDTVDEAINIFVVGIWSQKVMAKPEIRDLQAIAGGIKERVFTCDDADELYKLVPKAVPLICDS